jgi:peptide/nickel transport system permease protein
MTMLADGRPIDTELQEAPPPRLGGLLRATEARLGLILMVVMALVIVVGPLVAPYPPNEIGVGKPAQGPSAEFWLGTDQLGRDVWSRFLNGGASVLLPPIIVVVASFLIGGGAGMLAAYRGGSVDTMISRAFDVLLTMPALLLVLAVISAVGDAPAVVIATVTFVFIPRVGRVIRGATQAVVANDYVAAAQLRGEKTPSILVRDILPNIAGPAVADFALRVTFAVMFISTLNFLGIGAAPPSSAWGLMVADSRGIMRLNPWPTLAPAIGIALLAIATNLLADAFSKYVTRDRSEKAVL